MNPVAPLLKILQAGKLQDKGLSVPHGMWGPQSEACLHFFPPSFYQSSIRVQVLASDGLGSNHSCVIFLGKLLIVLLPIFFFFLLTNNFPWEDW